MKKTVEDFDYVGLAETFIEMGFLPDSYFEILENGGIDWKNDVEERLYVPLSDMWCKMAYMMKRAQYKAEERDIINGQKRA